MSAEFAIGVLPDALRMEWCARHAETGIEVSAGLADVIGSKSVVCPIHKNDGIAVRARIFAAVIATDGKPVDRFISAWCGELVICHDCTPLSSTAKSASSNIWKRFSNPCRV